MKKLSLILCILCFALFSIAQAPAGYYSSANGLTGNALKAELNNIIDGHTEYSYSQLWDILQVTDRDPNNGNNVIGNYSRFSMNGAAEYDGGSGWNREHVWAKSRGDLGVLMDLAPICIMLEQKISPPTPLAAIRLLIMEEVHTRILEETTQEAHPPVLIQTVGIPVIMYVVTLLI